MPDELGRIGGFTVACASIRSDIKRLLNFFRMSVVGAPPSCRCRFLNLQCLKRWLPPRHVRRAGRYTHADP
jgi:hypothetical protein